MLKTAIIFTILASFLAGCATGPEGYMKRSANNKLFDRKGFNGSKRAPIYNKKYISQAKKNILNGAYDEEEIDEDELYEDENISRENIEMYKAMIEADLERAEKGKKKKTRQKPTNRNRDNNVYPSIVDANNRIDPKNHADNLELREEIDQIKSMLNEAKKDLASYKCPTAKELERLDTNSAARPRESLDRKELPDAPMNSVPSSTIIDPVKSI
ncbi:MAG: hypothetical protein NWP91_03140 [Rickettsiaceae bacterium]|nr:hypothetical protein [Rickettsiaceae bacterium]MDP5020712.1 hypothetical protein [Rickettsiaceae bacterium]MDP5083729.1 hypothetical protein [Rickettsiaceae bacterium]